MNRRKFLLTAGSCVILTACGGSGGSKKAPTQTVPTQPVTTQPLAAKASAQPKATGTWLHLV